MSGGGRRLALLIDCGTRQPAKEAVDGLDRIAYLPVRRPTKIVVTHLHSDHYNGLTLLANTRPQSFMARIGLVQARLPRDPIVRQFVPRLLVMDYYMGAVSGIPDLDLAASLTGLSSDRLDREPRSKGERFEASGYTFDVLWPPRTLTSEMSGSVHRAVNEYEELAQDDPVLREALDRVRESESIMRGIDDLTDPSESPEPDATAEDPPESSPDRADEAGPDFSDGRDDEPEFPPLYKRRLESRVKQAAARFRKAANDMSLVFATPHRDLVAWGDASRYVVRRVVDAEAGSTPPGLRSGLRRRHVALAPHHGSQGPTPALGSHMLCVSSNGKLRYPDWVAKHEPCPGGVCLATFAEGDLFIADSLATT